MLRFLRVRRCSGCPMAPRCGAASAASGCVGALAAERSPAFSGQTVRLPLTEEACVPNRVRLPSAIRQWGVRNGEPDPELAQTWCSSYFETLRGGLPLGSLLLGRVLGDVEISRSPVHEGLCKYRWRAVCRSNLWWGVGLVRGDGIPQPARART